MSISTAITASQGDAISVEMAEIRVSARLTDNLIAYGLGSCIGLCMYDPVLHVAGMAHIVMPERKRFANADGELAAATASLTKFADTCVPCLLEAIIKNGGERNNLRAAYAGGAAIFGGLRTGGKGAPSGLDIGERNAEAVSASLKNLKIPVNAVDIGGRYGRTVLLRVCDGAIIVKPIGGEGRVLTILGRPHDMGRNP